jgi:DNA-binding transcriptional ArsR family regulator
MVASSVELADMVADALGLGGQTVRHHLRNLGEQKLVSYRGRGRHAAEMTSLDAARLVITAAGSQFVKDSVATLARFGSLRRGKGRPKLPEAFLSPYGPLPHDDDGPLEQHRLPGDDDEESALTLESFLQLRIDRLRHGYPPRRDRRERSSPFRRSDRLAWSALELYGGIPASDPRAFAVVRWWPPGGRSERAEFRNPSATPMEQAADIFMQYPDIQMLAARFVSQSALEGVARALDMSGK